jgi:dTDP-4-dehydrorhamnose 3,5-epimerase-like enzyme
VIRDLIGNCYLRSFPPHSDDRGNLVALEGEREVPFPIARVYFLYGSGADTVRGFHAHQALKQLAICVSGACTFVLDDGARRQEIRLESPDVGLVIGAMVWREMHDFTHDCVLLVLASEHYDETDYIRDYSDFLSRTAQVAS